MRLKLRELLEVLGFGTMIQIVNMKNDAELYKGTVEGYAGKPTLEVWNVNIEAGLLVIDVQ